MMRQAFGVGRSVQGRAITGWRLGDGGETTLFLGVHHGSEPHGGPMLERLTDVLEAEPERLAGRKAVVVSILNPDGLVLGTRQNANGVDLNRNLPTQDWSPHPTERQYPPGPSPASEPETRALVALVEAERPLKIVTIHAPLLCVNWNGLSRSEAEDLPSAGPNRHLSDGRPVACAEDLGAAMAALNTYPLAGDIGYPCPGSFGTWAGHERRIATITLELGRSASAESAWEENRAALLAALAF